MKSINRIYLMLLVLTLSLQACEKMIEVDVPANQLESSTMFLDSTTANTSLNGLYGIMYNGAAQLLPGFYGARITVLPARTADELLLRTNPGSDNFGNNSIPPTSGDVSDFFTMSYAYIYHANTLIEGAAASGLSAFQKRQLTAEAKFLRAFVYFYLTNYFGDVPLALTTDVNLNRLLPRAPSTSIYQQIITDLKDAQANLLPAYPVSSRTRVNKWAATALLARVYLYTGNWSLAEQESSTVISQNIYRLPALDDVFLAGSSEAIFQFSVNTLYGYTFTGAALLPPGILPQMVIQPGLLSAFEAGDLRREKWISSASNAAGTYLFPSKYKSKFAVNPNTEFEMVLRLGEQYLIRAESRIQQNKIALGIGDLNLLRTRSRAVASTTVPAPLPALSETLNQPLALQAVAQERRIELFSEYGHRWLDLKRTGQANAVLGALKGNAWQPEDVLYPIPSGVMLKNPEWNQNLGYN